MELSGCVSRMCGEVGGSEVSTKSHLAARRRQAQSRKTSRYSRARGASSRVTVTAPAAPKINLQVPVMTMRRLLSLLPTEESFARSASEELRMNLSAPADANIENSYGDAIDDAESADVWSDLDDEVAP